MSDEPENLTLRILRAVYDNTQAIRADIRDVKHRLTALEIQVGQQVGTEQSHYASVALRLDRIDDRLDRLERRADILPANTEPA